MVEPSLVLPPEPDERWRLAKQMGDVTCVYLNVAGEQYTLMLEGDIVLDPGQNMAVTFPQDRTHVFDGETGEALRNRPRPRETTSLSLASGTRERPVRWSASSNERKRHGSGTSR